MQNFERQDWGYSVYSSPGEELNERVPSDMPEPLGKGFTIRCYVDAVHAGESVTWRPRTGFVVILKNAPVHWFLKKQTFAETSTFDSEMMAMKQAGGYLRGLR